MFENLKFLYGKGLLDAAALERAVGLGWLSEDQKQQIMGG